jgi:site-specific DNA-methyltransferase (adenine-specific)
MNNRFENTDSLSFLATIAKGVVDLVLTDPPYIISHETGFKSVKEGVQRFAVDTEFGDWDKSENFSMSDLEDSVKEYYRVLRDGGTAIIFCDLWKVSYVKEMMEKHKFKQIRFIDWVKTNPVPLNSSRNYLTNAREVALLGVKRSKPTFNSSYHSGLYRYPICHDKGRFHPTQKPLQFMKDLITTHSNENDVVLDTFAGAGTTLIAAKELGRQYLGCELDKEFYDKAEERLK